MKQKSIIQWTAAGLLCGGLLGLAPSADAVLFRLPLASNAVGHYYYDHSGPGWISDWKCQTETYDGHVGTDFGAPRYTAIYCAAVGTLAAKQDGWGDGSLGTDPSHANYVIVNHASGMRTLYWHMQIWTVTTKAIGSAIACSEQIGQVGNSGMTSGPHLHFEPQLNGVPDDPYAGSCAKRLRKRRAMWITAMLVSRWLAPGRRELRLPTNSAQTIVIAAPRRSVNRRNGQRL